MVVLVTLAVALRHIVRGYSYSFHNAPRVVVMAGEANGDGVVV
ncbi:hypothetical protein [Brucella intermedia]|nr:hypothetical protein [Brucella intermedia]